MAFPEKMILAVRSGRCIGIDSAKAQDQVKGITGSHSCTGPEAGKVMAILRNGKTGE